MGFANKKPIEPVSVPEAAAEAVQDQGVDISSNNPPVLGEALALSAGTTLFLYPALQQRISTLVHMVDHGKAIILVVGDFGSGKSTLAEHCEREYWRDKVLVHINAVQDFTVRDLVKAVATATGVSKQNLTFQELCKHLTNQSGQLNHVLVIDDAHNLSQDNLRALLCIKKLLAAKQSRFAILLFSEPDIKHSLIHDSLRGFTDGWANFIYLPRLNEVDVSFYVEDRLLQCGYQLPKPRPRALKAMHQASGGLPIRINEMLARDFLDARDRAILHRVVGGLRRTWLLLLLLAALAAYYYLYPMRLKLGEELWGTFYGSQRQLNLSGQGPLLIASPAANSVLAGSLRYSRPTAVADEAADTLKVALTGENPSAAESPPALPPAASDVPLLQYAAGPVTATAGDAELAKMDGAAWFKELNPAHYTLQLRGAYNTGELRQFLQQRRIIAGVAYLHILINDHPWHLLVHGEFSSVTDAERYLAALPRPIQDTHPSIRRIGPVQEKLD